MQSLSSRPAPRGLVAAALLVLGACSSATGPSDHQDPAGMRASAGGTVLVSVNAARQVTGSFNATIGQSSAPVEVRFLDTTGAEIAFNPSEYYVRVQVDNGSLVTVEQSPAGAATFQLRGLAAGTTALRISLMHGQPPGGHADYTSPSITVVVAP